MNSNSIAKGAFLALCLLGMLVLPAAAAGGPGMNANGKSVDQGLKEELWANHVQYRLQQFDLNAERAGSAITILGKYGVDTTACQATLTSITAQRSSLETALRNKDKNSLSTINRELKNLWKQYELSVKEAVRAKFGNNTKNANSTESILPAIASIGQAT